MISEKKKPIIVYAKPLDSLTKLSVLKQIAKNNIKILSDYKNHLLRQKNRERKESNE